MSATTILNPIDVEEEEQTQLKQLKDAKKQLNYMKEGEDITYEQLLLNLNVSEETHLAIRSTLISTTLFLKRQPDELRINNNNGSCLSTWRANMDIQLILFLMFMHVPCILSLTSQKLKKLLVRFCELLVMKHGEKDTQVSSNKSEI